MIVNLDNSFTYNQILRSAVKLQNGYPKLISLESIGVSHDKREIISLKLGKGTKGVIMLAGVHARECINPAILLAIIEKYANRYYSYGLDLLNRYAIYFIPLLNPDGYSICKEGYYAINNSIYRNIAKQSGVRACEYKANARAIDINRNFASKSFRETEISGQENSENETIALIDFCKKIHPLGLIDFHSRGNSIFYYRAALDDIYNQNQFKIACRLSQLTSYSLNLKHEENPDQISGGNTVNFFSETFKRPAITIETVKDEEEFPLKPELQSEVFREIKEVPYEFLKMLISAD